MLNLNAIFVLHSDEYHTDAVVAALEHGKHVLIEKPMCLTRQEAEAIIKARDEAGVQVMVGYMRRYAPAFVQAGHCCTTMGLLSTALFAYEGFTVTFETGIDHNRRFDAHIQVYGETKDIRVQYNTPYIRHLPTLLFLNETHGEAFEEQVIRPTFTDAYTVELLHNSCVMISEEERESKHGSETTQPCDCWMWHSRRIVCQKLAALSPTTRAGSHLSHAQAC